MHLRNLVYIYDIFNLNDTVVLLCLHLIIILKYLALGQFTLYNFFKVSKLSIWTDGRRRRYYPRKARQVRSSLQGLSGLKNYRSRKYFVEMQFNLIILRKSKIKIGGGPVGKRLFLFWEVLDSNYIQKDFNFKVKLWIFTIYLHSVEIFWRKTKKCYRLIHVQSVSTTTNTVYWKITL